MKTTLLCTLLVAAHALSALGFDGPQPRLPTTTLTVGGVEVTAEVADTEETRSRGLMFRESLGPNEGMLFVMPYIGPASFYMKNTKIPLSIAYIGPHGNILEIHDLVPLEEKAVRSRFQTVAFALEMERGWFSNNGIFPGAQIKGLPPPAR